jgi:hypothetical protein
MGGLFSSLADLQLRESISFEYRSVRLSDVEAAVIVATEAGQTTASTYSVIAVDDAAAAAAAAEMSVLVIVARQ